MVKKTKNGWLKRKMNKYPLLDEVVRIIGTPLVLLLILANKFENGGGLWQFMGLIFGAFSWWVIEQGYPWQIITPVLIVNVFGVLIIAELLIRKYRRWKKRRSKK